MKLPSSWTTITPLSKIIAMIIFIIVPFLAFFLGVAYQQKLNEPLLATPTIINTIEKIVYQPLIDTTDWKVYTNSTVGITFKYPPTWKIQSKHTFSNNEIDDPKDINTAVLTGKEGEIVLKWGNMGFGGGCDNWKHITIDGKDSEICSSPFEKGAEIWAPITNGARGEKANELQAVIKPPLDVNRHLIFTIFSTIDYF